LTLLSVRDKTDERSYWALDDKYTSMFPNNNNTNDKKNFMIVSLTLQNIYHNRSCPCS